MAGRLESIFFLLFNGSIGSWTTYGLATRQASGGGLAVLAGLNLLFALVSAVELGVREGSRA